MASVLSSSPPPSSMGAQPPDVNDRGDGDDGGRHGDSADAAPRGATYWHNRQVALQLLRREVLYPYFSMVEELRITTTRAIDVQEVVKRSFRDEPY